MNSPASSETPQLDQSWGWDHHHDHHHHHHHHHSGGGVTMSVGLETRLVYQDYDWGSSPMLAMNDTERKPQIMSGALVDSHSHSHNNIGQYNGNGGSHVNLNVVALNGMLSSRMPNDTIIAAAQPNNPLASLLSTRGYGGISPGHHVLEGIRSSSSCLFGNGHNIFSGYNGCSDSRAALEEQRHHLLGMMSMDQKSNLFHNVKHEELCAGDFQARIGLNLGGRTYFSTEDNIVNRLYKRARAISPGSQVPRCQAEGCKADLSNAKHYHRRHKVCELHSKAPTVVSGGISQRFCQQCSRFHVLAEFDEGKRSCRKRLADHNRRRRKPQPNTSLNAPNGESATATATAAAVSPVKATEADHDTNSGSNQSNVHQESIPRTEAQALLTGISLSPSLPLVLHTTNGKDQYLQQSSPSLSRGEMGIDYSRQSPAEKYTGLEIAIPWLKPSDSASEFGRSEKNNSSNGGQISESGTSTSTVQVFSSIQSLLPSLQSSTELGNSDWMMPSSNNARNHQHYGAADLNLQTNFEGQHMLSLQEKNVGDGSGGGRGRQNAQNAVEYLSQGGLNSKPAVDGHSEGFSGIQSFRSLGQSMYQNIL